MSNKKRINKKLQQLNKRTFHIDFGKGHSSNAISFFVGDELKSIDKTTLDNLIRVSCNYVEPFSGWVGFDREIATFKKYQLGFEFNPEIDETKYYRLLVPKENLIGFDGLLKVGFSAESAYETLKETYKF